MSEFITGTASTLNTDQFHKRVLTVNSKNTLLSKIMVANGIKGINDNFLNWTTVNYKKAINEQGVAAYRQDIVEGQDAGEDKTFLATNHKNRVQIIQNPFGRTHSQSTNNGDKQNTSATYHLTKSGVIQLAGKTIADALYNNINWVDATTSGTAPKAQGLKGFVENVIDLNVTGDAFSYDTIESAMAEIHLNDELSENVGIFIHPSDRKKLNAVLPVENSDKDNSEKKYSGYTRTVDTAFGEAFVYMDENIERGEIYILSLDVLFPVFKKIVDQDDITGKEYGGYMFIQKLARTGSKSRWQLYGEFTFELGSPTQHARIVLPTGV